MSIHNETCIPASVLRVLTDEEFEALRAQLFAAVPTDRWLESVEWDEIPGVSM